jgi:hypothetical protein
VRDHRELPLAMRSFAKIAAVLSICFGPTSCGGPTRLSIFDYAHRPSGYHWVPGRPHGPGSMTEYYGIDPASGWTVYVGPDGIYYTFAHRGPIEPGDLRSYWHPHDAPAVAASPRAASQ